MSRGFFCNSAAEKCKLGYCACFSLGCRSKKSSSEKAAAAAAVSLRENKFYDSARAPAKLGKSYPRSISLSLSFSPACFDRDFRVISERGNRVLQESGFIVYAAGVRQNIKKLNCCARVLHRARDYLLLLSALLS